MMPPLGPVETLPREAAPCGLQHGHIEAHAAKPFDAICGHFELLILCGDDQRALLQRLGHSYAEATGAMVVAASSELQIAGFPAARHSTHSSARCNRRKSFKRPRNARAGKPVGPMPPLR